MNSMVLKYILASLFSSILFFSCSKKGQVKGELEAFQSQIITLCLDSMEYVERGQEVDSEINAPSFQWVVYADSLVCSSCKLSEMYKWDELLRKVGMYGEDLKFYFILFFLLLLKIGLALIGR